MANEGKKWEEDFSSSFTKEPGRLIRLHDTTNGFKGIRNPCDFIYYSFPEVFLFECKSVASKRLPFNTITENQWAQLQLRSQVNGITGGILVQFREERTCYFIPIELLVNLDRRGERSISEKLCRESIYCLELPVLFRKTRCSVDEEQFRITMRCHKSPQLEEDRNEQAKYSVIHERDRRTE